MLSLCHCQKGIFRTVFMLGLFCFPDKQLYLLTLKDIAKQDAIYTMFLEASQDRHPRSDEVDDLIQSEVNAQKQLAAQPAQTPCTAGLLKSQSKQGVQNFLWMFDGFLTSALHSPFQIPKIMTCSSLGAIKHFFPFCKGFDTCFFSFSPDFLTRQRQSIVSHQSFIRQSMISHSS